MKSQGDSSLLLADSVCLFIFSSVKDMQWSTPWNTFGAALGDVWWGM